MAADGVRHAHDHRPEPANSRLRIELLPAGHGDSILIEYGTADGIYRVLIDGGPATAHKHVSARIAQLSQEQRQFELLVTTRILNASAANASSVVLGAPPGAELVFNYRTPLNEIWDAPRLQDKHGYRTRFPPVGQAGIAVDL